MEMYNKIINDGNQLICNRSENEIIKNFSQKSCAEKEISIHNMLKNKDLTPKLMNFDEQSLTTEYIKGHTLFEDFETAIMNENIAEIYHLIAMFESWYDKFLQATDNKIYLNYNGLNSFIIKGDQIYCIDFESAGQGSKETDISYLATSIIVNDEHIDSNRILYARIFLSSFVRKFKCNKSEILLDVDKAFKHVCKIKKMVLNDDITNAKSLLQDSLEISAVVLAGGISSRMGKDKKYLFLKDKTFLQVAEDKIKIYASAYISTSDKSTISNDLPVIYDDVQECGAMGGMITTLRKITDEWVLFLPCDMPYITPEMLDYLVEQRSEFTDAVLFTESGTPRSFPILVKREAVKFLFEEALRDGELSFYKVIYQSIKVKELQIERFKGFSKRIMKKINTPQDYEKIENATSDRKLYLL